MNILAGVIVGFLVLMLLVVAHEFGHFIAARKNGVEVEEFGIGFPPRAKAWLRVTDKNGKKHWQKLEKSEWGKKQKSLVFSINWLPIGGFCSMKGESDSDRRPHSFGSATFWQKTKILFAGVGMNWLVAWIIMSILAATGMPEFMDGQFHMANDTTVTCPGVTVHAVEENSPAASANIQVDDHLISANGDKICTVYDVFLFNSKHAGETVSYEIERNGENSSYEVTLNPSDAEYQLGITMSQSSSQVSRATWSAPIVGAINTVQLTGETYKGLFDMLKSLVSGIAKQFSTNTETRTEGRAEIKAAGDSVSGPVGIIGVLFPESIESGPTTLAFLAAIISISLACMNVLPIPALDGGRFFLIALFRIRGKTLTKEIEERVVARAFVFLLALIVFITILDIIRII